MLHRYFLTKGKKNLNLDTLYNGGIVWAGVYKIWHQNGAVDQNAPPDGRLGAV
jgi:hypothetical protein